MSNIIKNEIDAKTKEQQNKIREQSRKAIVYRAHNKGSWTVPGNQLLKEKAPRGERVNPGKLEWLNKDTMTAQEQQKAIVDRLMTYPNQRIEIRTEKHATKDNRLFTPHVFRNEGGNLMSSIAGAGANKFHEFRQIRRNDLDRETHFAFLRQREKDEIAFKKQKDDNDASTQQRIEKNRKKRQKKERKGETKASGY